MKNNDSFLKNRIKHFYKSDTKRIKDDGDDADSLEEENQDDDNQHEPEK